MPATIDRSGNLLQKMWWRNSGTNKATHLFHVQSRRKIPMTHLPSAPARKSLSSTDPRTIPTVKKRAQQTSYRTNAPAFIPAPPLNVLRIRYLDAHSGYKAAISLTTYSAAEAVPCPSRSCLERRFLHDSVS